MKLVMIILYFEKWDQAYIKVLINNWMNICLWHMPSESLIQVIVWKKIMENLVAFFIQMIKYLVSNIWNCSLRLFRISSLYDWHLTLPWQWKLCLYME